jgi:FMN phosphatase YigB (HAD superfamily)
MPTGTRCSAPFLKNASSSWDRLKERYQVLLLSNTNAIHVPAFEAIIAKENGISDFKSSSTVPTTVARSVCANPMLPAFHTCWSKHGADPTRTLFIDDSIQHVHGARAAGLHAEHLELAQEDVIGLAGSVCHRLIVH